ncbi:MAG TPA: hypothetical protein DHV36_25180 [Desulfobacteraceae bacterium]|mgnify:CR=1 FL=1|nr:hypothetical protein [Desulfobacteraceae bacterium]
MRLGFIGTGGITEAIVTGLCGTDTPPEAIYISARSERRSKPLEEKYDRVTVLSQNQAIVDNSDIVVLAFLPAQAEGILNDLTFRQDQVVVTLLAGVPVSDIRQLSAPARHIVRAIPLPCTALRTGPVVMYPGNDDVFRLFSTVGSVIVPSQESQLDTFSIITALMAPFYAMTDTVAAWGEKQGLDRTQSAAYAAAMFKALATIAETTADGNLGTLVSESMTPGGLNETAMGVISENGGFKNLIMALDEVEKKVQNSN